MPQNIKTLTRYTVIMTAVFPRLGGRAEALQRDKPDHLFRLWQPRGVGLVIAALVLLAYMILNVAILVVVPQVSLTSDGKGQGLPGRYYATVVFSLVALAIAYYAFVIGDATTERIERRPGRGGGEPAVVEDVVEEVEGLWGSTGFSLLSLAHVRCRIRKDLVYDAEMERVRHFGRRWRAFYILRQDLRVGRRHLSPLHSPVLVITTCADRRNPVARHRTRSRVRKLPSTYCTGSLGANGIFDGMILHGSGFGIGCLAS